MSDARRKGRQFQLSKLIPAFFLASDARPAATSSPFTQSRTAWTPGPTSGASSMASRPTSASPTLVKISQAGTKIR